MANSSVFEAFAPRLKESIDAGLAAAALAYQQAVQAKLAGGYTTGAFTSGKSAANVFVGTPEDGAQGDREIHVGTDQARQAYWELGGYNAYTREFERVEHWRNALMETGPNLTERFLAAAVPVLHE